MEWNKIETAPKDGTAVLIYVDEVRRQQIKGWNYWPEELPIRVFVGRFMHDIWETVDTETDFSGGICSPFAVGVLVIRPTHWMPLPAAPGKNNIPKPDQSIENI